MKLMTKNIVVCVFMLVCVCIYVCVCMLFANTTSDHTSAEFMNEKQIEPTKIEFKETTSLGSCTFR